MTAIKIDKFEMNSEANDQLGFSSSITDVFSAIFQQLDFIVALDWNDAYQSAIFIHTFSKVISKALDHYCDAIFADEFKTTDVSFMATWQNFLPKNKSSAPQDIRIEV